jgi:rhodanese-related sulfurtransferase
VEPADLAEEVAAGAMVVDIRASEHRAAEGDLPGALVIERSVLEWRLDPTSPHRLPESSDFDRRIVLVCNEGYSSSLAAETLQRIGLRNATDLVGGYRAWWSMQGQHSR